MPRSASPSETIETLSPLHREEGHGPLWSQLRAALIDFIMESGLKADDLLPSETELCRRFAVSRTVVREALNQLVVEGHVYRIQGKGTFVANGREDQDFLGTTVGFSSDFSTGNRQIYRKILKQGLRPATAREAKFMRIAIDDPVVELERLLVVDKVPRFWVSTALLPSAVPSMETVSMENKSLYETLRRQYGIVFSSAERWIEAFNADREAARMLDVPIGEALVRIESLSLDQSGLPVEYYTAIQRTDQSRLHFRIRS